MTPQDKEIDNISNTNKTLMSHFKKNKVGSNKRIQSAIGTRKNVKFQSSRSTFMSTEKESCKQSKYESICSKKIMESSPSKSLRN